MRWCFQGGAYEEMLITPQEFRAFFGLWDSQGQCWECNWILYCIMLDMEVLSNVRQLMILLSVQVWI